jgi:RNA polymerase-associated protein CTR9
LLIFLANIILLSQKSKDLDKVFANYKSALNIDPNFIPALIGLACVHYQRKNYKAALSFYQKVLKIQPDIVPDVRMPIGICFYKLDMEDEASLAFRRVLELVNRYLN